MNSGKGIGGTLSSQRPPAPVTGQLAGNAARGTLGSVASVATPYALQRRQVARSDELVTAVTRLDVVGDETVRRELVDWIRSVYDDRQGGVLVGLMSQCFLGAPYVDHRLSLDGYILEHFRPGDIVPPAYAAARRLAQSGAYAFVEIYDDGAVVPIRSDGSAVL